VFSDPSKRHGAKMTLLMRLAQNVTCFAVRLQPADFHDESDPRERWIVEAAPPPARAGGAGWSDKLKWMLPTAWFEQDVDDDDAEPRDGDGDAAERSEALVHRSKKKKDCRLLKLIKDGVHCQDCNKNVASLHHNRHWH
jgi:hypothetical protein